MALRLFNGIHLQGGKPKTKSKIIADQILKSIFEFGNQRKQEEVIIYMLEGLNAEKANQFAHRITSYMRYGAGEGIRAKVCLYSDTFIPSPRSPPPYPMPRILLLPSVSRKLTLILRNSIQRVHVCMIPERSDFEDKNTNQEQEIFHKDQGRTEGYLSYYLQLNI